MSCPNVCTTSASGDVEIRPSPIRPASSAAFDCAAAAGVAVAGLVIAVVRGAYWLDPAVAAAIAVLVGVGAVRLLVDVVAAIRGGEVVDVD